MNAASIGHFFGIHSSASRSFPQAARANNQPGNDPGVSDSFTLSSTEEPKSSTRKSVCNVLSFLSIASAIGLVAAGMVVAPAALVGVALVTGWMATDKNTPSKLTAWLDKREADAQAAAQMPHTNDPASPISSNPTTLTMMH